MKTMASLLALMSAGIVAGCGGEGRAPAPGTDIPSTPGPGPAPFGSCAGGGQQPPSKLVLHPITGIPGQYIVVLLDSVSDIPAAANRLAQKYGGRLLAIYASALRGFAVAAVGDASASALAQEADVCWVEQDSLGRIP
jgi:hypothetical protein